ncbi:EamA family transporter RarD [Halotalea alkalilenta]|uniref:EamA family transporter RarD n=1 Tax=Halotalea alkalilenta TaxID=376489 RepID=UPI0004872080|nr:EamA family transporter RarD [Halotalea alkalilenta]
MSAASSATPLEGVLLGLVAYGMWGCFPLYFSLFGNVPAGEILSHRILWSAVFLCLVIALLRRWRPVLDVFRSPVLLGRIALCAALIGSNWWMFIWAVGNHHVIQGSLGYYLTPLVSVALGTAVLGERLGRLQQLAIAFAVAGIAVQLVYLGELPWISLAMAGTFGCYGLFRKQIPLDGITGLLVETLVLLPVALGALVWSAASGQSHFGAGAGTSMLLISSGALTALPLIAFAAATQRLRLSTLGFLMYLNPTLQLLIAVNLLGEQLAPIQLVVFGLIWIGLLLYTAASVHDSRVRARKPA